MAGYPNIEPERPLTVGNDELLTRLVAVHGPEPRYDLFDKIFLDKLQSSRTSAVRPRPRQRPRRPATKVIHIVDGRQVAPPKPEPPPPEPAPVVDPTVVRADHITVTQVTVAVARAFNVRFANLQSRDRHSDVVVPRHVAFYLARELTDRTLSDIGQRMGGFDHTTVMNGIRKTRRRMEKSSDFAAKVEEIAAALRATLTAATPT